MKLSKKKKISKTKVLILISIIILLIYTVYSLISVGADIKRKENLSQNLEKQISEQQTKNDDLKDVLNNDIEEYIERIAREKYGYIKSGEHIFYDISSEK